MLNVIFYFFLIIKKLNKKRENTKMVIQYVLFIIINYHIYVNHIT